MDRIATYLRGDLFTFLVSTVALILTVHIWAGYYVRENLGRLREWPALAMSLGSVTAFAAIGSLAELAYVWFYIPATSGLAVLFIVTPTSGDFVYIAPKDENLSSDNEELISLDIFRISIVAGTLAMVFALLEQSWLATIGFFILFAACVLAALGWSELSERARTTEAALKAAGMTLETERTNIEKERAKFDKIEVGFAANRKSDREEVAGLRGRLRSCEDQLAAERRSRSDESSRHAKYEGIASEEIRLLRIQFKEAAKRHSIELARVELADTGKEARRLHARLAEQMLATLSRKGAKRTGTALPIRDLAADMGEPDRIGHVWVVAEDLQALERVGTRHWAEDSTEWTERVFIMPKGIEEAAGRGPRGSLSITMGDNSQIGVVAQGDIKGGVQQSVRLNEDEAVRAAIRELLRAAEEPVLAEILEEDYPEVSSAVATVKESRNSNTVAASLKAILRACREIGSAASPLLECALKVQQALHGGVP